MGEMCAKGLKRTGYCIFGNREYMSLIKGGHSSYQLDVAAATIRSSSVLVDCVVTFNHHGLVQNLRDLKPGGIMVHQTPRWKFKTKEDIAFVTEQKIRVIELPTEEILKKLKAKPILGNVLITAFVWSLLGRKQEELEALVREQFGHKKDLLEMNLHCIAEGFVARSSLAADVSLALPAPDPRWKDHLLITGSQAMALGTVHAGCRCFFGYPMTPASPLLTVIADLQNQTKMLVKQAEDEITAAQMMVGAMHMGTRAMTATSGGGFDLMTETLSLTGITETPAVFVLAQRPGPGTGLPTWTTQGDLLMAIGSGHGEYPRLVMAVSDTHDCFDLMNEAFNYAEEFQIPAIVLTDKQIAEALFTQIPFDQKKAQLRRGKLVTDASALKQLHSGDRYDPSVTDGVSKRWLPGSEAAVFCGQGDEHTPDGSSTEDGTVALAQMEKRLRKIQSLKDVLPEPELYEAVSGQRTEVSMADAVDILIVGWGSTKGPILDVMEVLSSQSQVSNSKSQIPSPRIGYLHFTYLWPLNTERFKHLVSQAKQVVLVEGNLTGQLGLLLRQETGIEISTQILKGDGRPYFFEELQKKLLHCLTHGPSPLLRGKGGRSQSLPLKKQS